MPVLVGIEDLDPAALAAAQRRADRRDRRRVGFRHLQKLARLAADDLRGGVTADATEAFISPSGSPFGVGHDHGMRGEARHLRESRQFGGDTGDIAAIALAALHDPHRGLREALQRRALPLVEAARHAIDDAERTDARPVREGQRNPRIETDVGRAGHQRVVGEARVSRRVLDLEQVVPEQGMRAEGQLPRRLLHALQTQIGLEPLAVRVDEADERDGRAAHGGGRTNHRVQLRLRRRIEHAKRTQGRQALRLVVREAGGRHGVPRGVTPAV